MAIIVEEFDAVSIKNSSIQFFEGNTQKPGTKFGCVGSLSGETESKSVIKVCEGVEAKKRNIPLKMNLTISAHIPVAIARSIFGLSNTDLKPGVYSYGPDSLGKRFVYTADIIDDFEEVTKLIAFPNCSNEGGFKITVENGQDEVAQLELTFTALVDSNKKFYYEAIVDELEDATIATQWHTQFTSSLVSLPTP